jgi:predicted nucleic acid-binding protein
LGICDSVTSHALTHHHRPLLHRAWELRDALGAPDALYVALAEALGATLVTLDRRLARSNAPRCTIDVPSVG